MRRKSRSLVAVAVVLGIGVLLALYWTQDSSPVDMLKALHGAPASGGHGS